MVMIKLILEDGVTEIWVSHAHVVRLTLGPDGVTRVEYSGRHSDLVLGTPAEVAAKLNGEGNV